jgi:hypothetical protein
MGMTGKISRFLAVAGVVLGVAPALAQAQGTTISGQVSGSGGVPVVGASVSIPALRVGGFTDDQGRYTFSAPASATGTTVTVTARRLGFSPSSAQVTLSGTAVSQNFSLTPTATQLTGVVVTALGIAREKSQLGTAVQQISDAEAKRDCERTVTVRNDNRAMWLYLVDTNTSSDQARVDAFVAELNERLPVLTCVDNDAVPKP